MARTESSAFSGSFAGGCALAALALLLELELKLDIDLDDFCFSFLDKHNAIAEVAVMLEKSRQIRMHSVQKQQEFKRRKVLELSKQHCKMAQQKSQSEHTRANFTVDIMRRLHAKMHHARASTNAGFKIFKLSMRENFKCSCKFVKQFGKYNNISYNQRGGNSETRGGIRFSSRLSRPCSPL